MKLINRETIKGTSVSAKGLTLASVLLTGAIALTATGCDAQIKADGITIDSLTITGSDAESILDGAEIKVNGQNVDIANASVPSQIIKEAEPSVNGNAASEADTKTGVSESRNPADEAAVQPEEPAEKENLYEAFLNGNAVTGRYWFGEFCDYGYKLSDLIDTAEEYEYTTEIDRANCVSYRYVDCGADGIHELLVTVDYVCGWYNAQTYFLIKDFNGKLYITYSEESWYRHFIEIEDDGEVTTSFSNGAFDHEYIKGFLNANGVYTNLYRCNIQDLRPDIGNYKYYDENNKYHVIEFYTDGLDVPYKDFSIMEIYIGDSASPVYTYSVWNENGTDTTTEANFEDTDRIVRIMNYYGLKVFAHSEIEEMVFGTAEQMGVLNYVSLDIDSILYNR